MSGDDRALADLLLSLTQPAAVSGREARLGARVREILSRFCDDVSTDALGSVAGRILPPSGAEREPPRLLLAAHMDEIGLVVQSIEESGALRVLPVGGVNRKTLFAKAVVVHGRKELPGLIGSIPPHLTAPEERKKIPDWSEFFVDVGLPVERVRELVRPGDAVSFSAPAKRLLGSRFASRALDDRAGLAALLHAARRVASERERLQVELVVAATVQEEVGLRGAGPLSFRFAPGAALAVDVGFGDMPGLPRRDTIELGKGPAITAGPNIHPGVRAALLKTAEVHGIAVQTEVFPGSSGTDAWAIQVSREGVPTGVVSIPLRSMHSIGEVVDVSDVEAAASLLAHFTLELGAAEVEEWNHGAFEA